MKIPPIETERLYLRGFTPEDARFALSIWNDPEMGEYLMDEAMETIDEEYLRMVEKLGEDGECCYLIAVDKDAGTRIGTCSFLPEGDVYDIAYCVHRDFWRQGYATEMVGGMIAHPRSQGAKKITIVISNENAASNAVAKKFGCRVAETLTEKKRGSDRVFTDYKYELDL